MFLVRVLAHSKFRGVAGECFTMFICNFISHGWYDAFDASLSSY